MNQIEKAANELDHYWIVVDVLRHDDNPDPDVYWDVIDRIRKIERNYTDDEIEQGDLLCDIW